MCNILRLSLKTLILIAVVLAAAVAQPEWARDLGLESSIENMLTFRSLWLPGRNVEPGSKAQALDERYLAKLRIILEVRADRLTLFEAAALFRDLNAKYPVLSIKQIYPGDSDEEQHCWQVIEYAARMEDREDSSDPVDRECSNRLKEELRRHKEQYGRVLLPDVARIPPIRQAFVRKEKVAALIPVETAH